MDNNSGLEHNRNRQASYSTWTGYLHFTPAVHKPVIAGIGVFVEDKWSGRVGRNVGLLATILYSAGYACFDF